MHRRGRAGRRADQPARLLPYLLRQARDGEVPRAGAKGLELMPISKIDELAKAMCSAGGHDPSAAVRLHYEPHLIKTPLGTVATVSYPEPPVLPLWHYWLRQAKVAIDTLESLERAHA